MKLIINFVSKLGVDSISRLIGFLTLPIITRTLGPDGYGLYTYLFVVLSYFGFFIDFGYLNYGTNKLCEKIDSSIVVGKIISLQLLTVIFSYVVLAIAGYFIFDFDKYILLMIFSVTFISQIFSIRYYYLAKNKLYFNSLSELAGQLAYAILIFFVFVKFPSVLILIVFSVLQAIITSVFLFIPYIKKNKIKINLNLGTNLKTLKEAYKLGLASKAEGVTASFVILCIGIMLNEESIGLYNVSYKIYLILLTIVQGLSYTLMPVLLKNIKISSSPNIKRISLIFYAYLLTGLILSVLTFIFSEEIIGILFGSKFSGSVLILKSFSITLLICPVSMFIVLMILSFNRYNYLLATSIFSMLLSIISSLILINLKGVYGAGLVLPIVTSGTIIIGYYFLKRISIEENFNLGDLFSINNFFTELSDLRRRKA